MKKLFIATIFLFLFLPLFTHAASCTVANDCDKTGYGQENWTCLSHTCQAARCGDGFCNACEFSPCGSKTENQSNCPQDCGYPVTPAPTPVPTNPAPATQFQDTDNGVNFYQKGTTTGKQGGVTVTRTDFCQNSQLLNEYSLDSNNNIKTQLVVCNNGCSNGACVQSGTCLIGGDSTDLGGRSVYGFSGTDHIGSGSACGNYSIGVPSTSAIKFQPKEAKYFKIYVPAGVKELEIDDASYNQNSPDPIFVQKGTIAGIEDNYAAARNIWGNRTGTVEEKMKLLMADGYDLAGNDLFHKSHPDQWLHYGIGVPNPGGEFVRIPNPAAGTYYFMIKNESATAVTGTQVNIQIDCGRQGGAASSGTEVPIKADIPINSAVSADISVGETKYFTCEFKNNSIFVQWSSNWADVDWMVVDGTHKILTQQAADNYFADFRKINEEYNIYNQSIHPGSPRAYLEPVDMPFHNHISLGKGYVDTPFAFTDGLTPSDAPSAWHTRTSYAGANISIGYSDTSADMYNFTNYGKYYIVFRSTCKPGDPCSKYVQKFGVACEE